MNLKQLKSVIFKHGYLVLVPVAIGAATAAFVQSSMNDAKNWSYAYHSKVQEGSLPGDAVLELYRSSTHHSAFHSFVLVRSYLTLPEESFKNKWSPENMTLARQAAENGEECLSSPKLSCWRDIPGVVQNLFREDPRLPSFAFMRTVTSETLPKLDLSDENYDQVVSANQHKV